MEESRGWESMRQPASEKAASPPQERRASMLVASLARVATVPRLRLWTQAMPEIPCRMLIYICVAPFRVN